MGSEERLTEIEMKVSRQDHLLDQLNEVIYLQQKQLDLLEKQLKDLSQKMPLQIGPANEKPPHY